MISLGKKTLTTAQFNESMWLKLGHVCFTASSELTGNDNNHKEASKNHTFTNNSEPHRYVRKKASILCWQKRTSCAKAIHPNMEQCEQLTLKVTRKMCGCDEHAKPRCTCSQTLSDAWGPQPCLARPSLQHVKHLMNASLDATLSRQRILCITEETWHCDKEELSTPKHQGSLDRIAKKLLIFSNNQANIHRRHELNTSTVCTKNKNQHSLLRCF